MEKQVYPRMLSTRDVRLSIQPFSPSHSVTGRGSVTGSLGTLRGAAENEAPAVSSLSPVYLVVLNVISGCILFPCYD